MGKSAEASAYYAAASTLSKVSSFVDVAATLGRAGLFIGLSAHSPTSPAHGNGEAVPTPSITANVNSEELLAFGLGAVKLTKGMGGTLEAIGKIIQASTSAEILRAK